MRARIRAKAIPSRTRIEQCARVTTSVRWPSPVDQRLNALVELVGTTCGEVSRSRLLAALVSDAPSNETDLALLVHSYTKKTAAEVVRRSGPIVEDVRQPGRRPRQA